MAATSRACAGPAGLAAGVYASTGAEAEEEARFVFTFIGARPRTAWLNGVVDCDEHGFVLTGPDLLRAGNPPAS